MRGGFLRPNPYNDRLIHDPVYEPFWTAAEELDFVIGFHEGGSSGMPTVGIDRFKGRGAAAHHQPHDGNDACLPQHDLGRRVRAASETARRLPRIGRRLDRAVARPDGPAFRRSGLQRQRPQDAARATSSGASAGFRSSRSRAASTHLADYIGPNKILWATDYPHRDGFFPGAPA